MSEPVVLRILTLILDTIGAAIVRRHVDEWEAARTAAEAQAETILGPRPR